MMIDGQVCQELYDETKSWQFVADKFNISSEAARNRAKRWRKKEGLLIPIRPSTNITQITSHSSTQQQKIISDCNIKWNTHVKKLKLAKKNVRYAFWTDIHAPYQDDTAIELAAKITQDFNPDVVNSFSDFFDFHKLSTFADHRSPFEQV